MPLSNKKQQEVQDIIEAASKEEREEMRQKAKYKLNELRRLKDDGAKLRHFESEAVTAIEILLRLEASESNKGVWFRTKRRMELMKGCMIA